MEDVVVEPEAPYKGLRDREQKPGMGLRRLIRDAEFSSRQRKAREVNRQRGVQLATEYLKCGSLEAAVERVFPDLKGHRLHSKCQAIAQTAWFRRCLDDVMREIQPFTALSPVWILNRMKMEAVRAKKASDRIRALELIAKHLGMFIERKEIRSLRVDLSQMPRARLLQIVKERFIPEAEALPESPPESPRCPQ